MRPVTLAFALIVVLAATLLAEPQLPVVAVHIEKHTEKDCATMPPLPDLKDVKTTYEGVGRIDALVILYRYGEARGMSLGLTWPEAWGEGSWRDCSHLKIGGISSPGDETSIIWKDCLRDTSPLLIGWLAVTVSSPGIIDVIPSSKQGTVSILDCNDIAPGTSEAMIVLRGGAGGLRGDDPASAETIRNRNWYVKPDSTGDAPTINDALRHALPGDTVFVAGGTYHEHLIPRSGVVVHGSWGPGFKRRNLEGTPSIIDGGGHHTVVRCSFRQDSTTVLDGFVITGGSAKFGGGLAFRNSASPLLRNLIIHSNLASYGAAIYCNASSPILRDVLIANNEGDAGGALYCVSGASPLVSNATIVANKGKYGAAIVAMEGSSPIIERSIIANHSEGTAIYSQGESAQMVLSCCDLWGNDPSDYGGLADLSAELRDNIAEDPLFKNPSEMDFTPGAASPVLSLEGCGRIGSRHARVPASEHRHEADEHRH